MTFIATVIAQRGAAIIADSLVTTSIPTIELGDFIDYIEDKDKQEDSDNILLSTEEISRLFRRRPSYTKDYEEKLILMDDHTVITTSGAAEINEKRISTILRNIKSKICSKRKYKDSASLDKVILILDQFKDDVRAHIDKYSSISRTNMIISHFNKDSKNIEVFKATIFPADKSSLESEEHKYFEIDPANEWEKVVCDGQNKISERILFGAYDELESIVPRMARRICEDFSIDPDKITGEYLQTLANDGVIVTKSMVEAVRVFKLRNLSLQQAVDLASLLMRIEIDFQTYTENIPTVGGVIKLGVLTEEGFKYISGHEIIKPPNI